MNYVKTLWENNKTVVDAENLNKIEDELYNLTVATVSANKDIDNIKDELSMKANINHTHTDLNEKVEDLEDTLSTKADVDHTHLDLDEKIQSLKEEIFIEFNKYFDDVTIDEDNYIHFYSNQVLIKSLKLPTSTSKEVKAICGDILCGEAVAGQALSRASSHGYTPTIWQDGITPVDAENLNKIENKILELTSILESQSSGVHIGDEQPIDTTMLWVDTDDEDINESDANDIIELFAEAIRKHETKINELFYITDAYLDDGEFEDENSEEQNLDGGIF